MHVQVDAITWDLGSHRSQFQHLQYLGASAATQGSFAQLHAMAYQSFLSPQGLQADSPATYLVWDSLFETVEEDSVTPFLVHPNDSKAGTTWTTLPSSLAA